MYNELLQELTLIWLLIIFSYTKIKCYINKFIMNNGKTQELFCDYIFFFKFVDHFIEFLKASFNPCNKLEFVVGNCHLSKGK